MTTVNTTLTVSREEREEIAKTCFNETHMFHGKKIVDLNKAIKVMRKHRFENDLSNIVKIKETESFSRKRNKSFSNALDRDFDIMYGLPLEFGKDGEVRWRRIQMQELMSLDLTKDSDAKLWVVLRMYHGIAGCPINASEDKFFHVDDPVVKTRNEIKEMEHLNKGWNYINNSGVSELIQLARFCGLGNELQEESAVNKSVLIGILLRELKSNPTQMFMNISNEQKVMISYINAGMSYGLITQNDQDGYVFKETFLGTSIDEVVLKFKEMPQLFHGVINAVNDKDTLSKKLLEEEAKDNKKKKEK